MKVVIAFRVAETETFAFRDLSTSRKSRGVITNPLSGCLVLLRVTVATGWFAEMLEGGMNTMALARQTCVLVVLWPTSAPLVDAHRLFKFPLCSPSPAVQNQYSFNYASPSARPESRVTGALEFGYLA